ncbi:restriction endonuclease subunit S [Campylobacter showae]|uniref:Type I restriction-modification system, specificity subunit S n=1 Tax=Campylobacter showae CSUNSWCD TaxID=1244083 RepID=M5IDK1_9BACT|nr:restriction endonuclease subunit S [Campylobacter showae]EKU10407.1 Type I restriction-modification system, specificity subunit S [Campylobacter showae CSUNSWCD]
MSEFKNLPSGWKVVRLGEICNVKQGLQIPISERFCENAQNRYFYITNEFLKEKSEVKYYIENPPEGTICFCDDILMTRTGNTGMVVTNVFGVFHNNFFKIAYDRQLIKKEYFVFLLTGPKIQNEILKRAGSSTIPDLNHGDFLSIKISIPPLDEQEKIAEILSTWDEAINLTINLIESKKQFKKALMQNLLTAKIRFPEFQDEWLIVKLEEVSEIYQPQTISQSELTDSGFDVYGANGIIGKYSRYNHEFEQVVITCRGNTCGAVNFTKPKSWITGNAMVINLDNSTKAIKTFIYYLLSNTNFQYLISGSGQPQITSNIRYHKIKLPNLDEQQKIAEVLTACDDEINLLNLKLENLKKQKQGLMQKLLSAKVRVK